jgi:hypothetical protein
MIGFVQVLAMDEPGAEADVASVVEHAHMAAAGVA